MTSLLITSAATTPASTTIPTTAPTTMAAAVSATTTVATTTAASLYFGTGLVYVESASADLAAVEGGDRFVSLFRVGHLHKSETA
jgi:hypothetical protein